MKKYKLTDKNMQTFGKFQWVLGKDYEVSGTGDLCSEGWLHFYDSPELAVLLNPIHADIKNPRLFEAEVSGKTKNDNGLKSGWQKAKLIKELQLPKFTQAQLVAFSLKCTLRTGQNKIFVKWAKDWLSGEDRSLEATEAVAYRSWTAWPTVVPHLAIKSAVAWATKSTEVVARRAAMVALSSAREYAVLNKARSETMDFSAIIKEIKGFK